MGRRRGDRAPPRRVHPFTADLGHRSGTVTVVVRARDDHRGPQARGKQSTRYDNYECLYTRTTGIWQTVWAEPVADVSLGRPRITPDVAGSTFHLEQPLRRTGTGSVGDRAGWTLTASVRDAAGEVVGATVRADLDLSPRLTLVVPSDRVRLWSPEDPHLYDLTVTLTDAAGEVVDTVETYAGLRSVSIDGKAVLLNGRPVFQRLVLDQGYYPDGLMTAPSDEALVRDIQLALDAGFNGARLHQKVFEERFLFHADRLGYLVWGSSATGGRSRRAAASAASTSSRRRTSCRSGWRSWSATTPTPPSSAGAGSTRPVSRSPTAVRSSTT